MLLHKVHAVQSFENIITISGILYPIFKAAHGLLDDYNEWHETLVETSTQSFAKKLRNTCHYPELFTH